MSRVLLRRMASVVAVSALVFLGVNLAGPSAEAATTGWFQTSTIPVGIGGFGAAFDPSTGTAYFTDTSGNLAVIDAATGTLKTTVSYGPGTGNGYVVMGLNDVTHKIYAANNSPNTVSVIDTTTNTVIGTIPVAGEPDGVAVDSSTNTIYIAGDLGVLSVIDGATDTVVHTVAVGPGSISAAVDPVHDLVYTTNLGDGTVSVVDTLTNTVAHTIPLPGGAGQGVVADPATGKAYVSATDGNVYVIDGSTGTVIDMILGGSAPFAGTIDAATNTLFIPDYNNGTVRLIDLATDTVTATFSGIAGADGVAVDESTGTAYAAAYNDGTIAVLQQVTSPTIGGLNVAGMVLGAPFTSTIVVSGGPSTTFAVTAGALPAGLTLDPATGVVSGTPTAAGAFSFAVTANNAAGDDQETFSGSVAAPPSNVSLDLTGITAGTPVSATVAASGGGPFSYAITAGSLPAGLALDPATGVISGTPTTAGSYSFHITVSSPSGVCRSHRVRQRCAYRIDCLEFGEAEHRLPGQRHRCRVDSDRRRCRLRKP